MMSDPVVIEWLSLSNCYLLFNLSREVVIQSQTNDKVSMPCNYRVLVIYSQNIIQNDMPRLNVFDLLRESDAEFVACTDWCYTAQAPVYVTDTSVVIQEPVAGAPQ